MFRFHKTLDVLTLFHSPRSSTSTRILSLLKDLNSRRSTQFELNVVPAPQGPTQDQLKSIFSYIGKEQVGEVVRGASTVREGLRMMEEEARIIGDGAAREGAEGKLIRPIVVDWGNGRVVLGGDERGVERLVDGLEK